MAASFAKVTTKESIFYPVSLPGHNSAGWLS